MTTFVVRVRDSREAIGIFSADDREELCYLVDEVTAATDCEFAEIRNGGVIWPAEAGTLPVSADWEKEQSPLLQLVGRPEVSEAWFYALTDEDLVFEPLVEARDVVANEP
jgi:hypothetical protein